MRELGSFKTSGSQAAAYSFQDLDLGSGAQAAPTGREPITARSRTRGPDIEDGEVDLPMNYPPRWERRYVLGQMERAADG